MKLVVLYVDEEIRKMARKEKDRTAKLILRHAADLLTKYRRAEQEQRAQRDDVQRLRDLWALEDPRPEKEV